MPLEEATGGLALLRVFLPLGGLGGIGRLSNPDPDPLPHRDAALGQRTGLPSVRAEVDLRHRLEAVTAALTRRGEWLQALALKIEVP